MTPTYTQEQVDQIVRRVLQRATVGFLILFIGTMGTYWNGRSVSKGERDAIVRTGNVVAVDGCNRDFEDRKAIRSVLLSAQKIVRAQKRAGIIDAERAKTAEDFYDKSLRNLPLPDCRKSATILSTEATDVALPKAMHP